MRCLSEKLPQAHFMNCLQPTRARAESGFAHAAGGGPHGRAKKALQRLAGIIPVPIVALVAVGPARAAETDAWRATLERISSSVVSIKVDSTRAFDTEWNSSGQATGFVVDAKRGLILTNRHVVTPGPVRAEALSTILVSIATIRQNSSTSSRRS